MLPAVTAFLDSSQAAATLAVVTVAVVNTCLTSVFGALVAFEGHETRTQEVPIGGRWHFRSMMRQQHRRSWMLHASFLFFLRRVWVLPARVVVSMVRRRVLHHEPQIMTGYGSHGEALRLHAHEHGLSGGANRRQPRRRHGRPPLRGLAGPRRGEPAPRADQRLYAVLVPPHLARAPPPPLFLSLTRTLSPLCQGCGELSSWGGARLPSREPITFPFRAQPRLSPHACKRHSPSKPCRNETTPMLDTGTWRWGQPSRPSSGQTSTRSMCPWPRPLRASRSPAASTVA